MVRLETGLGGIEGAQAQLFAGGGRELGVRDVHADHRQQGDDHEQDQPDDQGRAALLVSCDCHGGALLLP